MDIRQQRVRAEEIEREIRERLERVKSGDEAARYWDYPATHPGRASTSRQASLALRNDEAASTTVNPVLNAG